MTEKRRQFTAAQKQQKIREFFQWRRNGFNVHEACKLIGITPKQCYAWQKLYANGGADSLQPKSRRPKRFGNQISESIRSQVICEAQSGKHDSANKIQIYLASCGVKVSLPTVIKILEEANLFGFVAVRGKDGKLMKKRRGLLPVNR